MDLLPEIYGVIFNLCFLILWNVTYQWWKRVEWHLFVLAVEADAEKSRNIGQSKNKIPVEFSCFFKIYLHKSGIWPTVTVVCVVSADLFSARLGRLFKPHLISSIENRPDFQHFFLHFFRQIMGFWKFSLDSTHRTHMYANSQVSSTSGST